MNENILKWVWLTTKNGINSEKISSLLNKFNNIDEIYDAKAEEFKDIDLITKGNISSLSNKDMSFAEKIIETTQKSGAYILTYDSVGYPERLKYIVSPPYVLYVKGTLKLNDKMFPIGIVGTREPTEYGEVTTRKFSFELAKAGFTVVSGLARGIDAIAASSALRAGGNTIAVLGCGIDVPYPKENLKLRSYIEQYGAVITEYPPKTAPLRVNFPQRNRIIAGLSECLLVTQAPEKSGALITARYAMDMGRNVFGVPADIYDKECLGNNNLLAEGALCAPNPSNIIEQYRFYTDEFKPKVARNNIEPAKKQKITTIVKKIKDKTIEEVENIKNKPSINDERYRNLKQNERIIIELIIEKEKISVDEIIRTTNLPPQQIGAALSLMELTGVVKKLAGNFYTISEK